MTTSGLILYDLLKGTRVRKSLRFLEGSQHWGIDELEGLQQEKLVKLLGDVSENVALYFENQSVRERESQRNRESESQRVRESESQRVGELENWPVLDRGMVMEAGDKLLSKNINLKKCKISRTGGTSGPPLRLYRDTETRSWALAAYYRFYQWMGIEPGMPEAELLGTTDIRYPISDIRNPNLNRNIKSTQHPTPSPYPAPRIPHPASRTSIFNRLSRFRSYNAFFFNDLYLEVVIADMQKFKPKLIRGYLSAILLLANYIKRKNIKGIEPVAVSSTSEMLFPEYRKLIEDVFQAPLFDQYGCGECNSIAFECKAHNGMHITMEHCLLEQDEDNNFIVTNLDNFSQPFIRYKNGDKGIISHEPCSCGNAAPRIMELHGRASENIILKDGASVNGIFFANLLDQIGFINNQKMLRFQVVQEVSAEIMFRAEVNNHLTDTEELKLKDALRAFFNKVEISQHEFLEPGPGGKFRYIVSKI